MKWIATYVLSVALAATVVTQAPSDSLVAFTGGRLITLDPKPAVSDVVILTKEGRVTAIGPPSSIVVPGGAKRINLDGRFVLPGMISAHVHVSDVAGPDARAYTDENTQRQLGVFARYGITTVLSLGGEQAPAFRARESQGARSAEGLRRSRIFLAGDIITGATPDAARAQVARVAALKPDFIKIRVDDNLGTARKMTPDVFQAVIDEAHQRGLRVAAHVYYLDDAKALLKAGVDMIAHSVRDKEIDGEFVSLMKARDIPYCPTLTRELSTFVYESTPKFFEDPFFLAEADPAMIARLKEPARQKAMAESKSAQAYKAALGVARKNLKKASDAGLLIVMGTDSGAFPERFQGYFEHVEMTMMREAGLSPAQVLRAATADAARALRTKDVGALTPGAWADFVVLGSNPLDDIANTRTLLSVWVGAVAVPVRHSRSGSDTPETVADLDAMAGSFAWSPTRPLAWSDFQGRPNLKSPMLATSSYVIGYDVTCVGDAFSFTVEARFLPTQSWVKAEHLLDARSASTLNHERTHFDLSEVQARRARRGLAALEAPCALSEQARDQLMRPYIKDDAGLQAQYDRETLHGILPARQASWDQQVRQWLRDLPR
ncbi:MAG TPA: amidohydrolase family protein [Vicinamibacterales bacterium]|nr:amidohydrolase family protein [Vicinamibacterales bacterium]